MTTSLVQAPDLANELGIKKIWIKSEGENRSGSHKDRAIWPMIEKYAEEGDKNFVISSSGNAAISAAYFFSDLLEKKGSMKRLHIFISPNISSDKRDRLKKTIGNNEQIIIHELHRTKSEAIKFAKENKYKLLRTSVDDVALVGYEDLAKEILIQLEGRPSEGENVDVFVPSSSGTTLQGLYNGFYNEDANKLENVGILARLHAVQTTKCATLVKELDLDFDKTDNALASAIADQIGHRKEKVLEAIQKSDGAGWVISDEELREARELLENNTEIRSIGWDSLLSLAGLLRALKKGKRIENTILFFTGK